MRIMIITLLLILTSCSNDALPNCGCDSQILSTIPESDSLIGQMFYKKELENDSYYINHFWIQYAEPNCGNCVHSMIICNNAILGNEFDDLKTKPAGETINVSFSGDLKSICKLPNAWLADETFRRIELASIQKVSEEQNIINKEGYIVGFDPCTIDHHYRIGYVIITEDLNDTLATYNLSDDTFKMPASVFLKPSDTLYKIPELYFENYRSSPFFPDSLRYKYPIKISYTIAKDNEMIFNLCTTDIVSIVATQVIIKSATK